MSSNSIACNYLGWGELTKFQSKAIGKNEALIFAASADNAPMLIQGFLDCLHSPELQAKIPPQYSDNDSENDLAAAIVEMVRTLPPDLWQNWANNNDRQVICAVLRWSVI